MSKGISAIEIIEEFSEIRRNCREGNFGRIDIL